MTNESWTERWQRVHRDPRAEMLCTADENLTQFVEIRAGREQWVPALLELLRLRLIDVYVKPHWEAADETWAVVPQAEGREALLDERNWDLDRETRRSGFGTTTLGHDAKLAEAFHYNDAGLMNDWP